MPVSSRAVDQRMERVSLCPFTAGEIVWQAQGGAWTLSICVKATFALVHESEAAIADVQDPIEPADLVPFKPKTDVLLRGHAYAPEGRAVEALVARFSVGDFTKAIGVVGDRVWRDGPDGLEPSPPEPFTKMPLSFERAARGKDNPVGVDLAQAAALGEIALPNLEAADDAHVEGRTVSVGPVDPTWRPRRRLLDEASARWLEGREGPMPDGFEFRYFNVAPEDQQLALVRHGAVVSLENLSATEARIVSRLPLLRPKAFLVHEATQRATEVALRCDTVSLDADRGAVTLHYRGLVGVEGAEPDATIVIAAESPQKRLHYRHIEQMLKDGTTSSLSETGNELHELGRRHDTVKAASKRIFGASETPVPPSWNASAPSRPGPLPRLSDPETTTDGPEAQTARIISNAPTTRESMASITIAEDGWGPGLDDFATEEQPPRPARDVAADVGLGDYVRITLQLERGEVGSVLNEYGIGLAELATLRESWAKKLAGDSALSSEFDQKLAAARAG
jgi:hypothetical protein